MKMLPKTCFEISMTFDNETIAKMVEIGGQWAPNGPQMAPKSVGTRGDQWFSRGKIGAIRRIKSVN